MKKVLSIVLVLALLASPVFSAEKPFGFVLTELDQHSEILGGFLPTLTTVGVNYNGLSLMQDNLTQLQFTVGGGYTQNKVYQSPALIPGSLELGAPLDGDFFTYDTIQARWNLKFSQGFGDSWVPGNDLLTAYVGYQGRWDKNIDSMVAGQERYSGVDDINNPVERKYTVPTFSNWQNGALADSSVYPDLSGSAQIFGTMLFTGLKLNGMADDGVSSDGILADLNLKYAPKGLSSNSISFYSATLNVVVSKTLLQVTDSNDGNTFSIVVIDRANVNWTDGSAVPVYAQGSVSLGRKVRGFNTNSYNTQFSVVNNLDVRFSGPNEFLPLPLSIFPRINLFFDCGYHMGRYFNSQVEGSHFLASTGVQLTISFMDFIDLGLQMAYTLSKAKNVVKPWTNLQMGATFFLDF